ncbi:peroxiredoxin, partial [Myxococcota bacterium]|nr:peroxiredoxin [Myxococcota bacterium]
MSIFSRAASSLSRVLMGGPSHLQTGNQAPELGVMSTDGGIVSVGDLRGQPWVLYFYPKDETPGCTAQACDLRDSWERIAAQGVKVFGCSLDGVDAHK